MRQRAGHVAHRRHFFRLHERRLLVAQVHHRLLKFLRQRFLHELHAVDPLFLQSPFVRRDRT